MTQSEYVVFDTSAGYVQGESAGSSFLKLSEVEPTSFKTWQTIEVDYT